LNFQAEATTPRECQAQIRGQTLAWREWGDPAAPVVLCLHGWLDNASSFDALATPLGGWRLIGLDMPGHGFSAHRPAGGTYNIWDDLPDLCALLDELGVDRFRLIGHSRGAMIASLLASVEQSRVDSLVLLDGINAPGFTDDRVHSQLRNFAHDYGRRKSRDPKVYASVDEAIQARCQATDIDPEAARQLVPRSLQTVEGGVRWRNDPRLRYASALKFSSQQNQHLLAQITAPVLLMLAERGHGPRILKLPYLDSLKRVTIAHVDGCHHCHMLSASTHIANQIRGFWSDVSSD